MSAFTDKDYENMVAERDEARARCDEMRGQIMFYRNACTARFLPPGFGDETMRALIDELTSERDEARAEVDRLRGGYQYSIGLSMALEERDQLREQVATLKTYTEMLIQQCGAAVHRERYALNQMRKCRAEAEELRGRLAGLHHQYRTACADTEVDLALMDRAGEALGKRAGEALDEAALRVVTERDEARLLAEKHETAARFAIEDRDGWKKAAEEADAEIEKAMELLRKERDEARWHAEGLRAALVVVESARDEARAEVEYAYREGGALYEAKIAECEAFRRGAEAMREACAQWAHGFCFRADDVRALPIPEEP